MALTLDDLGITVADGGVGGKFAKTGPPPTPPVFMCI